MVVMVVLRRRRLLSAGGWNLESGVSNLQDYDGPRKSASAAESVEKPEPRPTRCSSKQLVQDLLEDDEWSWSQIPTRRGSQREEPGPGAGVGASAQLSLSHQQSLVRTLRLTGHD